MIYADKSQFPELVYIWQQSFGDGEDYIRMFLEANFDRILIPVYEHQSSIVSVAYLLPVTYCDGMGLELPCYYLYAAATHPEYRGQGCFGKLLQSIERYIEEPIFLVPGEEGLAEYYKKQGLMVWQEVQTLIEEGKSLEVIGIKDKENIEEEVFGTEISPSEYAALREWFLYKEPHIKWKDDFIEYICMENAFCGGKQVKFEIDGIKYIMMYRIIDDILHIQEILPHKNIKRIVQKLHHHILYKRALVELKPMTLASPKIAVHKETYFNLTLG